MIALILLLGSLSPVMADDTSKCKQQESRAIKIVPAPSERRTALVIGNAAYENSPLANTINDACAIAAVLRQVGFEVTLRLNTKLIPMRQAIDTFVEQLKQGGVGLFYFAGHGIQADGENYLLPIDTANIKRVSSLIDLTVRVGNITGGMEEAKNRFNIVILDACRDNPLPRSTRGSGKGLASVNAAQGFFIAYSTAPNTTAADGPRGSHSPYAEQLIRYLAKPGWAIESVFKKVREGVSAATGGNQVTWESVSIIGDFFFVPSSTTLRVPPRPPEPPQPPNGEGKPPGPSRLPAIPAAQDEAYQMLAQGDIDTAVAVFQGFLDQDEPQIQSQGQTGLAAVAWARGDAQQTLEHAAQAETLDPEVVYSYVLRGHLLWQQGKTEEAAAAYRTATAKTHGLPWQQAVAYNRLGRLYAAQGDVQHALEQYDKALSQPTGGHPDTVIAYTNKGHLLATMGKFHEAIVHYRQAQQLNPTDRLSAVLLQEAEQRQKAAQDQEKQGRIDQLIATLLQAHKEGKAPAEQGDGWTSPPLTLALLHVQTQGTPSPRAGEEDAFLLKLVDALQATGRIVVLERDILDKLLTELKLGASELVDPQVAVRVGRILAARLLATGTLTRRGMETQLSLRVVETETTRLRAAVTDALGSSLESERVVDRLAATLVQKLRAAYPLQGRILQAAPQRLLLNIGAEQGVTPGMTLQVLNEEPLHLDGKAISAYQLPVGLIEVTSVEPRLAQARALEQTVAFEPGWKVKEK
jgi:tetratricopeptide (TPR) repeat protein